MHYLVAWNYFTFVTGQNVLHKIQPFFSFPEVVRLPF